MITRFFILVIALLLLGGCNRSESVPTANPAATTVTPEATFAEQLELVLRKQSATILLEQHPITAEDFASIPTDSNLQVVKVDVASEHTESSIAHLIKAKELVHLRLTGKLDAGCVAQLAKLSQLKILNLPQSEISDADLIQLAKLPKLIQLRIESHQVTDASIQELAKSTSLLRLHLIGCPITDNAVALLGEIPQLESLYLDNIAFSDAAIEKLIAKRPELHLHLNQLHHQSDQRPEHGPH